MAPVRCCKTCGRDTTRRGGVCAQCLDLDSPKKHDAPSREDEEFDIYDDGDSEYGYDHDIEQAVRDALDLE